MKHERKNGIRNRKGYSRTVSAKVLEESQQVLMSEWKGINLQETLASLGIWAVRQSLPKSGGVTVLISMGFGLALQG